MAGRRHFARAPIAEPHSDEESDWLEGIAEARDARQRKYQPLERRLIDISDGLPVGGRKVFAPFHFFSHEFRQEIDLCSIIRGFNEQDPEPKNSCTMLPMRSLPGNSGEQEFRQIMSNVQNIQLLWMTAQTKLRNMRKFITANTFRRC